MASPDQAAMALRALTAIGGKMPSGDAEATRTPEPETGPVWCGYGCCCGCGQRCECGGEPGQLPGDHGQQLAASHPAGPNHVGHVPAVCELDGCGLALGHKCRHLEAEAELGENW